MSIYILFESEKVNNKRNLLLPPNNSFGSLAPARRPLSTQRTKEGDGIKRKRNNIDLIGLISGYILLFMFCQDHYHKAFLHKLPPSFYLQRSPTFSAKTSDATQKIPKMSKRPKPEKSFPCMTRGCRRLLDSEDNISILVFCQVIFIKVEKRLLDRPSQNSSLNSGKILKIGLKVDSSSTV